MIEHEIGDLQANDPPCAEIESEVLSGENPTISMAGEPERHRAR